MPKKLRDQAVQSADDTKHPQRVLNGDNGGSRTAGGPSRWSFAENLEKKWLTVNIPGRFSIAAGR